MSGEQKFYKVSFAMEFVVAGAKDEEHLRKSLGPMHAAFQLFQPTVGVSETEAKASEVRWVVDDKVAPEPQLRRKPLTVLTDDRLRDLEAIPQEAATSVQSKQTYVYDPALDLSKATGVDFRYVVSSKHGGAWIEVNYLTHILQQQQAAQMRAMQQQQAQAQAAVPPRRVR